MDFPWNKPYKLGYPHWWNPPGDLGIVVAASRRRMKTMNSWQLMDPDRSASMAFHRPCAVEMGWKWPWKIMRWGKSGSLPWRFEICSKHFKQKLGSKDWVAAFSSSLLISFVEMARQGNGPWHGTVVAPLRWALSVSSATWDSNVGWSWRTHRSLKCNFHLFWRLEHTGSRWLPGKSALPLARWLRYSSMLHYHEVMSDLQTHSILAPLPIDPEQSTSTSLKTCHRWHLWHQIFHESWRQLGMALYQLVLFPIHFEAASLILSTTSAHSAMWIANQTPSIHHWKSQSFSACGSV